MSDCVSFVQDGSNETDTFDMERKQCCDPGLKSRALETTGTSQHSAAEQPNIIGFGGLAQCG